jgi:hypothetical protein
MAVQVAEPEAAVAYDITVPARIRATTSDRATPDVTRQFVNQPTRLL